MLQIVASFPILVFHKVL